MSATEELSQTFSSDAIHNRNCYIYLLQLKSLINEIITQLLPNFIELHEILSEEYYESFPYGDLYSLTIKTLKNLLKKTSYYLPLKIWH